MIDHGEVGVDTVTHTSDVRIVILQSLKNFLSMFYWNDSTCAYWNIDTIKLFFSIYSILIHISYMYEIPRETISSFNCLKTFLKSKVNSTWNIHSLKKSFLSNIVWNLLTWRPTRDLTKWYPAKMISQTDSCYTEHMNTEQTREKENATRKTQV